jgi:hypothetical protein
VSTIGNDNIYIGHLGAAAEENTIRIGQTVQTRAFIDGIFGTSTGVNDAVAVMVDSAGQLGTVSSSARYKQDIHDMGAASERLMHLRPVTFRYKQALKDGSQPLQYGLVAEEVAETFPELSAYGANGQIETVKYHVLPAILLNEVQRQQREISAQQELNIRLAATVESQQARIERLEKLIEQHFGVQTSKLQ